MGSTGARPCPQCGTLLSGASEVHDLCSACLLSLGLSGAEEVRETALPPERSPERVRTPAGTRSRTLRPAESGVVAPTWAMPVELLRQASRRLRLAALGVGLSFAVAIVLNNAIEAAGWYAYSHLALKNMVAGFIVVLSTAMAWFARSGRLTSVRLLQVSLAYEIAVAFCISVGDHLEPLQAGVPLNNISWLCIWIVMFPLMVPASPRWALLAGVASASTWPLVYFLGRALGNPPAPAHTLVFDCLENYIAAGVAMFSTIVIRRLQELGCYELVEMLDHGGMGEIWRARHRMLARPVAVKLIRPELLGAKSSVEAAALVGRFQREAAATAALHSSHTVALHDFGVTREGAFYYVMELLDGLDLETLVRDFGPVPPERAIHLLVQACDSLAEAHAVGLIHRDVKPANIVACHWGLKWDFAKVLDFGLVKATWSTGGEEQLTSEGMITGTPAYMAPEAVLGRPALDARVDLYGLGCVAYWLLTGQRVFTGHTPVEVLIHHVNTAPVSPSERAGIHVPPSLEALVLSCLAKDPNGRPPSAEWLAARLVECETAGDWTPQRARAWWEKNWSGASRFVRPEAESRTTTAPGACRTPMGS
jgi:eukaryotic-like serine/threonine-protein kinase